jgi:hypothetical protein
LNVERDPFIKIVSARPGELSLRTGRDLLVEYDHGAILAVDEGAVFSAGPVRDALDAIAQSAGVDDDVMSYYVDTVALLVRGMVAQGHGGILIVSADEHPAVPESAPYRMVRDSSLATLLRLAWRSVGTAAAVSPSRSSNLAFGHLLRNAFLAETERVVEELGRLTAIDGAVLLNRELALVAFGLILRVGAHVAVMPAPEQAARSRAVDFNSRGTRHRAGATYAAEHPGSVVFVASEDGHVSCLLSERPYAPVHFWSLAA